MNNKPELEIFADDVQCAHGATCGAARRGSSVLPDGPRPAEGGGRALLVQAFLGEALEFVENDEAPRGADRQPSRAGSTARATRLTREEGADQ